jgi:hypothetical protein
MGKLSDYQTETSPAIEAGDTGLDKGRVVRGRFDMNTPPSAAEGRRLAQEKVRPGQGSLALGPAEEPATEEEEAEYKRAQEVLARALYSDDRMSNAVQQMLTPQEKIGSIAKATILVVKTLDDRYNFDEVVIPTLAQEATDRVLEIYEAKTGEDVSESEAKAIWGATWEGIMEVYGVDEEAYAELTAGMSDEQFGAYEAQYNELLNSAGPQSQQAPSPYKKGAV